MEHLKQTSMEHQLSEASLEETAENNFTLSPQEQENVEKILSNRRTLKIILSNISSASLFELRLLSKMWNELATAILTQRPDVKIYLQFDKKENDFKVKKGSLSELNEAIKSSSLFPCGQFVILNGVSSEKDLKNEPSSFLEFLTLHGKNIHTLNFQLLSHQKTMTRESFTNVFLTQLPNVKQVFFMGSPVTGTGNPELEPENGSSPEKKPASESALPNLKCIGFSQYFPSLSDIIRSAPNLQQIKGDPLVIIDDLIEMKKIDLIKSLNLYGYADKLAAVEKIAKEEPKLEELNLINSFGQHENRYSAALSLLLQAGSETIRVLLIGGLYPHFFVHVEWPTLKKVESIRVVARKGENIQFPVNFISDKFPNLTHLSLEFSPMNEEPRVFNNFLSTEVGLVNLKKIELSHPVLEALEKIGEVAKNLEDVKVRKIDDFLPLAQVLWTFTKLKNIQIELIVGNTRNRFPFLDMAITGLDEEKIHQLQNVKKGQEIIMTRPRPSILDCKDLETLSILVESDDHHQRIQSMLLFSTTSNEFGFKMLENVKFSISCLFDSDVSVATMLPEIPEIQAPEDKNEEEIFN